MGDDHANAENQAQEPGGQGPDAPAPGPRPARPRPGQPSRTSGLGIKIQQPTGFALFLSLYGWKLAGLTLLLVIVVGVRGINELINPSYGRVLASQAGPTAKREGKPLFALRKDAQWIPAQNGHFEAILKDPRVQDREKDFVWFSQTYNTDSDMNAAGVAPVGEYVDAETGEHVANIYNARGTPPALTVQCANQQRLVVLNPTILDVPKFLELLDAAQAGGPAPEWAQPPAEDDEDEGDYEDEDYDEDY